MNMFPHAVTLAVLPLLAACSSGPDAALPGEADDNQPFAGIGATETVHMTGTEPFWSAEVSTAALTYTTPENPEGISGTVERFAGRGGYSISGTLNGRTVDITVTPADCSDGMSDRSFPFAVTMRLGEEVREGCGWTDANPFTGPQP